MFQYYWKILRNLERIGLPTLPVSHVIRVTSSTLLFVFLPNHDDRPTDHDRTNNTTTQPNGAWSVNSSEGGAAIDIIPIRAIATKMLPFGDINVIILTDVHSFVGGHSSVHEPNLNADYGHVLSFFQHVQNEIGAVNGNVFLVNNGDFMDGTGLTTNPPSVSRQWDALI